MARKTKSKPSKRALEDDDILESDSEIDEFENYKAAASHPGASDSGDEDEDAEGFDDGFGSEEEEEGAGVGMYEPDEWDGGDSSSDDSDEDDEAAQMVSGPQNDIADDPRRSSRKGSTPSRSRLSGRRSAA